MTTLLALAGAAFGQDLVVDATTTVLSGAHAYDHVYVVNGGVLKVAPYDGSAASGTLTITATSVLVDATSRIDATGAGYTGAIGGAGNGTGAGGTAAAAGGGGGHGGAGAGGEAADCVGASGAGGPTAGALDKVAERGASGGAAMGSGIAGGAGGGSVSIDATVVDIRGRIEADGLDGAVAGNGEGAGGGAGGGVTLVTNRLFCPGVVSARGGAGGAGSAGQGGGGGGGRVETYADEINQPCTVRVDAGRSGCGGLGTAGADDAVADEDYDLDGTSFAGGDCDPLEPLAFPGGVEVCDGIDNNCASGVDEGANLCSADCTRKFPNGRVYLFCENEVSWTTAQSDCAGWGYTLADISDSSENGSFGSNAGTVANNKNWWIGYNDRTSEGDYVWDGGAAYTYENWAPSEPDGGNNANDCVLYEGGNGSGARDWSDEACTNTEFYACETCEDKVSYPDVDGDGYGDRASPARTCTVTEPDWLVDGEDCNDADLNDFPSSGVDACNGLDDDCDGDADETCTCQARSHGGHDYLLCTSTLAFDAARAHCERQGMTLATIDDADENAWLDGEVDALSTSTWLIGLEDRDVEGAFQWQFGDPAYDAFGSGQPDNAPTGADCVVLNGGGPAGTWSDDTCTAARRFVCETLEGCSPSLWHPDDDGDGFGSDDAALAWGACAQPPGYVADDSDCDDSTGAIAPGQNDPVADGIDQDCDGADRCFLDADGDTYGVNIAVVGNDLDCVDAGESDRNDDCDDDVDTTYPGAPETCGDGVDSECDGDGGPTDDEDGDGLTWNQEGPAGGSDCTSDTDGDGLSDVFELPKGNSDTDDLNDIADPDDDDDLILTVDEGLGHGEIEHGCANPDDNIPNYLDDDSDGDGHSDFEESDFDTDADGVADYLDCLDECETDLDRDGIFVCDETGIGTDPNDPDSDGDGIDDLTEVGDLANPTNTDGDGLIDAIDADDDGDNLETIDEDYDGDGDPRNDNTDGDALPDYLDEDDDGDGVSTLLEDRDDSGDPRDDDTDGDTTPDYLDDRDWDGPTGDPDGDGLTNDEEDGLGTDPFDFDTDGDGLSDHEEAPDTTHPVDTDLDGAIDPLDPDDDGDDVPTAEEGMADGDGDGLPNALDPDSDDDGIEDGDEGFVDADCDGRFDLWDADPTDRCAVAADPRPVYVGNAWCATGGPAPGLGALGFAAVGLLVAARRRRAA